MKRFLITAALVISAATVDARQQTAARPWLGMALTVQTSPGGATFLYVGQVGPDTPAAKAGMRAGDIITRIDGRKPELRDNLAILEFVSTLKAGQKIRMTLVRGGVEMKTSLVVGHLPAEYEQAWKNGYERAKRERHAAAAAPKSP